MVLRQEREVEIVLRDPGIKILIEILRRDDIHHDQSLDDIRMVQRQTTRDAGPAVVTDQCELPVSERAHGGDLLGGHFPLRIGVCSINHSRLVALATPADIRQDDGEAVRQARGDQVPAEMGLRITVQHEQGRSAADQGH